MGTNLQPSEYFMPPKMSSPSSGADALVGRRPSTPARQRAGLQRPTLAAASLAAVIATLAACNETPHEARSAITDYQVGNFAAAAQLLKPATEKKDENFVLSNCRYGSCALAAGELPEAENAFYSAYEVMDSVKTNDPGRSLGAAVVFEGIKVWKGEPFERAMAHYYLGMIYLIKNDYGNARAAFEGSTFKVREYAKVDDEKHYTEAESNFALGYFGLGVCNLRMGKADLAQASFQKAQAIDPHLAQAIADAQKPGVNTLLFVEAGRGPHKAGKGWYNEQSVFGPTPAEAGPIYPVTARADGQPLNDPHAAYNMVDTLAMAQQRHWQDIDTLREAKAVIGTGLMAGGTGVAAYGADRNDTGTALAGLGMLAAGALLSASSQSDLRSWEMLPRVVYIIPASLPPGPHQIVVQAGPGQSAPLQADIKPSNPSVPSDNVFYFRIR